LSLILSFNKRLDNLIKKRTFFAYKPDLPASRQALSRDSYKSENTIDKINRHGIINPYFFEEEK